MRDVIFRVFQVVMPCLGLWLGWRSYAWLSEHPAAIDPLGGAICLGLAVWVLGGALGLIVSDAFRDAYTDSKQTRLRSSFYAMLISSAALVISLLTYLTK